MLGISALEALITLNRIHLRQVITLNRGRLCSYLACMEPTLHSLLKAVVQHATLENTVQV